MESMAPNHTYYSACDGAWRGRMVLTIHDGKALRSALSWMDAWSVYILAYWPAWLGCFMLHTTVGYEPSGVVRHTTIIRWLGIPLLRSVETLQLHEDGTGLELNGQSKSTLTPWRSLPMVGTGSVNASASEATYECSWLGTTLRQTVQRTEDTVTLAQQAPGFTSNQTLHRQTPRG